MKHNLIARNVLLAPMLLVAMVMMSGCGKSVSGKYTDANGMMTIEFKSGGNATLTINMLGQSSSVDATYTIDGNKVTLKPADANSANASKVNETVPALTINDDGTLSGNGVTFKKQP